VTLLFLFSELCRLSGLALPVFANVTWRAMRATESRGIAAGPILFGVGIWLAIAVFSRPAATAGVLILAIGDSVASLVGRAFGNTLLPHNPGKTLMGSLSLFAVGAIIAMFYVSLPWALLVGAVASFVESLPLGPSDNLLLPLATSWAVTLALAVGG
jgi:phytol kinase